MVGPENFHARNKYTRHVFGARIVSGGRVQRFMRRQREYRRDINTGWCSACHTFGLEATSGRVVEPKDQCDRRCAVRTLCKRVLDGSIRARQGWTVAKTGVSIFMRSVCWRSWRHRPRTITSNPRVDLCNCDCMPSEQHLRPTSSRSWLTAARERASRLPRRLHWQQPEARAAVRVRPSRLAGSSSSGNKLQFVALAENEPADAGCNSVAQQHPL
jgi:hypothetical protein